jgi:hypothetical protein
MPRLSSTESNDIQAAWRAAVAHDAACQGLQGPELTTGSPGRALSSTFGILRGARTPPSRLRPLLRTRGSPSSPGAQLYVNQIHRARSAFGATFYVLAAGNVSGQRGVPARCDARQRAALERRLAHAPAAQRRRILDAQSRYLVYLRYLALHPEGICAGYLTRQGTADNLGCATLAGFHRWGVLADGEAYLGGTIGVFWSVVPDGVASVTLRFAAPHHVTITARAVNNVVVAREPWWAPYVSGFPKSIVLHDSGGRVIKAIAVTGDMPTLAGYGC